MNKRLLLLRRPILFSFFLWLGGDVLVVPSAAAADAARQTNSLNGIPAASVTPAAWLISQPKPQFRAGHTLPPLTRFGWTLPFEARVELAEHWGYALEFGGYATAQQVEKDLADTNSIAAKLCALTAANPKKYPLAVIVARDLPKQVPPETWARDAEGRPLDAKAQSMDGNVWDDHKTVWSPEAPDVVFEQAGALRANPLRRIRERCPIAIVLNGGEYALGVLGFARPVWEKDPRILKAKGERPWFDYISERKAHQELIISEAVRKAVPDRVLYSYYAYPKGGFGVPFPAGQPPHWLQQMTALAHVHALFSHLEPFLREGDLLPGPNRHRLSKELPAYEFPTGDQDVRVLARKLTAKPEWLVTAWAAAGPDREVKVRVPPLGDLTLRARGSGAVYRVRLANGTPAATLLDVDGLLPTKELPGNQTAAVTADDRLGEMMTIPAGSFLMGNSGHEGFEGPEEFPRHFVRGGCWDDGPFSVRCAYRGWYLPPGSSGTGPGDSDYLGFRVAR